MTTIDLNSDLGEGFGPWPMGNDEAMLGLASSVNVACGFHAGDSDIMLKTAKLAKERGTAILLVTHDPRILDFADRIVALEDGRIVPARQEA